MQLDGDEGDPAQPGQQRRQVRPGPPGRGGARAQARPERISAGGHGAVGGEHVDHARLVHAEIGRARWQPDDGMCVRDPVGEAVRPDRDSVAVPDAQHRRSRMDDLERIPAAGNHAVLPRGRSGSVRYNHRSPFFPRACPER